MSEEELYKYWENLLLKANKEEKEFLQTILVCYQELLKQKYKAIEYIKNNIDYAHIDLTIDGVVEDLLEILGDKENE